MCYAWKIVRNPFSSMVVLQSTRNGPNHCWIFCFRELRVQITEKELLNECQKRVGKRGAGVKVLFGKTGCDRLELSEICYN